MGRMPGEPLVRTSPPTRQGHDDHGFVLSWDVPDGESVLVALAGLPLGDARPYDTQEGISVRVRPGDAAKMKVESHMGELVDGALWEEGWQEVTFPLTGNGETEEAASIVVSTAQACALRISSAGGPERLAEIPIRPGDASVRFGAEPQRGYQGGWA